jgi:hypothetical protein
VHIHCTHSLTSARWHFARCCPTACARSTVSPAAVGSGACVLQRCRLTSARRRSLCVASASLTLSLCSTAVSAASLAFRAASSCTHSGIQ